MGLSFSACRKPQARRFLVDADLFPQTLAVLRTRAEPLGIVLESVDPVALLAAIETAAPADADPFAGVFGLLLQLPGASGRLWNPAALIAAARAAGAMVTAAVDPMAQVLMAPVAQLGVEIAVGSSQRFGIPIGFGGPHAAFFATTEAHKRQIPGRLVGQSLDGEGRPCAWRCKPANSTSAGTRPPATSAPPRCC
jgi:glycine dehydrogenase